MSLFKKKHPETDDLSIPKDREIHLHKSKKALDWEDAYQLWDAEYGVMRQEMGWKAVEIDDAGEWVTWQIGNVKVHATFDYNTGIVTERLV